MHAVVTGAAGFIGSHVAEKLLDQGHHVHGLDALTPYYDPEIKRSNVRSLQRRRGFEFERFDLCSGDIEVAVADADVVYHLAAQPGVRGSWAEGFATYARQNIEATQRLLEAARNTSVGRVVYASSSSVYGNASTFPSAEDGPVQPFSPYGVTKMAAEQLVRAYTENFGLPTASLRYFTVFGPRQRPEMAISRLIECAITGQPFPLYGDGSAIRDFTYVGDIAQATVDAGTADLPPGSVMNVGGGSPVSMAELIDVVGEVTGSPVLIEQQASSPGDVQRTGGTTDLVRDRLGWRPTVPLRDGISNQAMLFDRELLAG